MNAFLNIPLQILLFAETKLIDFISYGHTNCRIKTFQLLPVHNKKNINQDDGTFDATTSIFSKHIVTVNGLVKTICCSGSLCL